MQPIQYKDCQSFMNLLSEKKQPCVILFTGQKNADGINWCSDCQQIAPFYKDFQSDCQVNKLPFYTVLAGDRPTWKDPNNILRKHKNSKIKSVPTMGKWNGTGMIAKLQGNDIVNKKLREQLIKS